MKGVILALLISNFAQATPKTVIFFGGYASTRDQMVCWEAGAKNNAKKGYNFQAIPYPQGADAGEQSAVQNGESDIQKIVNEINGHPENHYVIAGHSSGSALAIAVAKRIKNPKQIELVSLDGIAPPVELQNKVETTCYYGENFETEKLSKNGLLMQGSCLKSVAIEGNCSTPWCLHFAVVNSSTPKDLNSTDYATKGYQGCNTNLKWLEESKPEQKKSLPVSSDQ